MNPRRAWALPLVPLYTAARAAEGALRSAGLPRTRRLGWPVISVGSLSAGGAGKTPVVIALARLLSERGWTVDILSRGYRRAGRGVESVDLLADDPARTFGDEPTLLAQRTGVPVWVGRSRFAAGALAEQSPEQTPERSRDPSASPGLRAHLLDDGFQHRQLARSFDLVLVTGADLQDTLLPAGNLREPLAALRRADALGVREEELASLTPRLRSLVGPEVPLWTIRRTLRFPAPLGIFGAGLRPLAFCAVARPENFAGMLAGAGCGVVDTVVFPDHHRFDNAALAEIVTLARRLGASGLVTTEKDAVKLSPAMLARLQEQVGPVMVVALDAAFVYESPVVRLLSARLRGGKSQPAVPHEVRSR